MRKERVYSDKHCKTQLIFTFVKANKFTFVDAISGYGLRKNL